MKAKRVPVIWVGLPPVRGTRSRTDVTFLNDLYKNRAEKAGVVYVDVWEGFIEESGEFSQYGPDVLGQVRRLRSGDGTYFTKAGARKLAHFVEREIKRLMNRALPVALPMPDDALPKPGAPGPSGPAPRPVAGPIVPLTGHAPAAEGLAGGGRQGDAPVSDPVALRVLVKGEAVAAPKGRADDFVWPKPASAVAERDFVPEPAAIAARPAPQQQQQQHSSSAAAPRYGGPVSAPRRSPRNRPPRPPARCADALSRRVSAAASSIPSGICRPRARPGGLRGSPRRRAIARAACRRPRISFGCEV